MAFTLKTTKGKLTAYAFCCGYKEVNDKTGLEIWHTSGCYHIGGYYKGEHFRRSAKTLKDARMIANNPFTHRQHLSFRPLTTR
jgi:hypothetical protein